MAQPVGRGAVHPAVGHALATLRRATVVEHETLDALVDPQRLIHRVYYAGVLRGLIAASEVIEATLPQIPAGMRRYGLSPCDVTKRVAIDAEALFVDQLAGPRPGNRVAGPDERILPSGASARAAMLGLLYVYVGSGLGGLHLLRVAQTAPWWQHDREHGLLRPYGDRLHDRWRTVRNHLERLDPEETNAAAAAARAGFDLYRRSLVDHLPVGESR